MQLGSLIFRSAQNPKTEVPKLMDLLENVSFVTDIFPKKGKGKSLFFFKRSSYASLREPTLVP